MNGNRQSLCLGLVDVARASSSWKAYVDVWRFWALQVMHKGLDFLLTSLCIGPRRLQEMPERLRLHFVGRVDIQRRSS